MGHHHALPDGAGAMEFSTTALLLPFTPHEIAASASLVQRLLTCHFYLLAVDVVF